MDEPYFGPIKNKDGIIMYIVDHEWWQTDNGCGGERSNEFAFPANILYIVSYHTAYQVQYNVYTTPNKQFVR